MSPSLSFPQNDLDHKPLFVPPHPEPTLSPSLFSEATPPTPSTNFVVHSHSTLSGRESVGSGDPTRPRTPVEGPLSRDPSGRDDVRGPGDVRSVKRDGLGGRVKEVETPGLTQIPSGLVWYTDRFFTYF